MGDERPQGEVVLFEDRKRVLKVPIVALGTGEGDLLLDEEINRYFGEGVLKDADQDGQPALRTACKDLLLSEQYDQITEVARDFVAAVNAAKA